MRCKSKGKISRQNFPGSIVDTRVATMWTRPRPHIRLWTRPRPSVRHARVHFLRAARPQMWPGSRPHSGHGRVQILVTAGSRFWSRAGPDSGRGRVQILIAAGSRFCARPAPKCGQGRVHSGRGRIHFLATRARKSGEKRFSVGRKRRRIPAKSWATNFSTRTDRRPCEDARHQR